MKDDRNCRRYGLCRDCRLWSPPVATITLTLRRTRSAAAAGNRSYCPCAQWYSMVVCSCRLQTRSLCSNNVGTRPGWFRNRAADEACSGTRSPASAGCCARAARGASADAAAPPSSVMNSRLFNRFEMHPLPLASQESSLQHTQFASGSQEVRGTICNPPRHSPIARPDSGHRCMSLLRAIFRAVHALQQTASF